MYMYICICRMYLYEYAYIRGYYGIRILAHWTYRIHSGAAGLALCQALGLAALDTAKGWRICTSLLGNCIDNGERARGAERERKRERGRDGAVAFVQPLDVHELEAEEAYWRSFKKLPTTLWLKNGPEIIAGFQSWFTTVSPSSLFLS